MVRSFNFSEMDIVRFFTAGLIGMDVVRYINNRSDKSELDRLINNLNEILNDVEVEDIDNQDPLYNLENYIDKHKPEIVYIEGIAANDTDKYKDVFQYIRDLSAASEIRFNIGFVNLPDDKNNETVDRIVSFFRN
jgi:hypothetical protein